MEIGKTKTECAHAGRTRKRIILIVLGGVTLVLIGLLLSYRNLFGRILFPLLYGYMIALLFHPLVKRLEQKWKRKTAIILLYAATVLIFALAVYFLIPALIQNIQSLSDRLPEIARQYSTQSDRILSGIRDSRLPERVKVSILMQIDELILMAEDWIHMRLRNAVFGVVDVISGFFDFGLGLFIGYYFLTDSDFFKEQFLKCFPIKFRGSLIQTGNEIHAVFRSFFAGQLLLSLIVGVVITIGLWIIGVENYIVLGVIAGLTNFVPYFGPVLGMIPAIAIALVTSPMQALFVFVLFLVVQQLESNWIAPKVMEKTMGIHPVTIVVLIIVGGTLYGIVGMIFVVPLYSILRILCVRAIYAGVKG